MKVLNSYEFIILESSVNNKFINDDAPIGEQGMTEDNFYEVAVGENQQGDR